MFVGFLVYFLIHLTSRCKIQLYFLVLPKIGVENPQNGWFFMEHPFKMDDLGPTPIFGGPPICDGLQVESTRASQIKASVKMSSSAQVADIRNVFASAFRCQENSQST